MVGEGEIVVLGFFNGTACILYIILASLLNHTAILSLIIQLGRHGASDGGRMTLSVFLLLI